MAAINTALIAREATEAMNAFAKREKSWPARNAGVMVVFCIVFVVAVGLTGLYISKCLARRKERNQPKY
ncbi:hypothetical protein VFPPC_12697 [Pochonia chlamydosporia 170]|uniref:Uncharacterized protein n=1 Tax=Pochonia chlamydosporia 170 TaxID=1380566 RepID=A0A179G3X9_METCM|nr:hypothetical protein VFPPC_12697 [Pochonia chlamydosporia 170]OAQ72061.1 hypothetical protein VFPPC_12697 [Pochonia chlamydosporia 170]